WRHRPPSVRLVGKKVDDVIDWISDQGQASIFAPFVRVKKELDREAMRAKAEVAAQIPGVIIGSAGEDFIVTPFETQIEGGK
ncbi:MAG: host-nuclease inhibitor Gam family protein, partial [Rhodoblastus sp.]|nr:host-nuclease inhibitor Gam family protein [Rhodoblastus sp.]